MRTAPRILALVLLRVAQPRPVVAREAPAPEAMEVVVRAVNDL